MAGFSEDFCSSFQLDLCRTLMRHKNYLCNAIVEFDQDDMSTDQIELCRYFEVKRILLRQTVDLKSVRKLLQNVHRSLCVCVEFSIFRSETNENQVSSWDDWNGFRASLQSNANPAVALNLTGINENCVDANVLEKWLCENITDLVVDKKSIEFLTRNYAYASFMKRLLTRCVPYFVLQVDKKESRLERRLNFFEDENDDDSIESECFSFELNNNTVDSIKLNNNTVENKTKVPSGDKIRILQQDHFLLSKIKELVEDVYISPYMEWSCQIEMNESGLDGPLKPVTDVLCSQTYANFEQDYIKYSKYGEAICMAILNIAQQKRIQKNELKINVAVLGASRGALVDLAYRACRKLGKDFTFQITAVEINPFAVIALRQRNRCKWNKRVQIKCMDLRKYRPDQKPDVIVSEFLGSFACNELAPELFSNLASISSPSTVIIPLKYTSYIQPCYAPKFAWFLKAQVDGGSEMYEQPYIINFAGVLELAKPLPLFSFEDPCKIDDLQRLEKSVQFSIEVSGEITGIFGYFHSILFEDEESCFDICTLPRNHTAGLHSWAPMFFPVKDPIYAQKGDCIVVKWVRANNGHNVWYEWQIYHAQSKSTSIQHNQGGCHNLGGKCFRLQLF